MVWDIDPPETKAAAADDSPRKELTISAQLASVDEQRATLLHAAAIRRAECLTELAELCHICGPLTRDDIPEGVLRRRRTKKPTRAPRAKKEKEVPCARP